MNQTNLRNAQLASDETYTDLNCISTFARFSSFPHIAILLSCSNSFSLCSIDCQPICVLKILKSHPLKKIFRQDICKFNG